MDSYYVYGGRSGLKFADGDQTNRDVMQREREVLDVMVANRDERIWKLAQGQNGAGEVRRLQRAEVPRGADLLRREPKKDAGKNTGQTSKTAEGSSAQIPSVAETLKKFTLAKGFKVECFASEEEFPELANATSMAFDTRGRLWVCTMPSYPQWRPGEEFRDKIVILEDSDGDGKANYATTFADKLHLPISFEFHDGGILVSDQRNLTFLKDTNGDDKADVKEVVLSGFDSADSHHVINAFTYGPGGDLYFQEGTFHHTQVETPYGPVRCKNAGTYRYEPRTGRLSVFVSYNYANPHGIAFDRWGQTFIADASGGMNYFAHGVQRPPAVSGEARRHAALLPQARAAHERLRVRQQPELPGRHAGQFPAEQLHRRAGHAQPHGQGRRLRLRGHGGGAARAQQRPELPPGGHGVRAGWRALSSWTGRRRSSATCNTASATRCATRRTAASGASGTRRSRWCSR